VSDQGLICTIPQYYSDSTTTIGRSIWW